MKTYRSIPLNVVSSLAVCLTAISFIASTHRLHAQGALAPVGGPAPVFKTLTQVEPRTDVNRLTGDATASRIISAPGSYYLTANVTGTPMMNGISIRANNVTLDLNGFALIGVPGSLDGINATMPVHNLQIQNGNIESWGGDGVDTSMPVSEGRYLNLRAFRNGANGLNLGIRSVVTECQAANNTLNGFQVASGVIKNCIAVGNGFTNGFPMGPHGFAIMGGEEGDVVKDCVADYNGGDGFNVGMAFPGKGTVITGCEAKRNLDDGIEVSNYCVVRGNNVLTNGVSGIHVTFGGTGNRIEDNHSSLQPTGYLLDPFTTANLVIKNTSQGNVAGYVVPPPNHMAAIAAFPGVGFAGPGPWTNFDY
jgi:hypothetical protein